MAQLKAAIVSDSYLTTKAWQEEVIQIIFGGGFENIKQILKFKIYIRISVLCNKQLEFHKSAFTDELFLLLVLVLRPEFPFVGKIPVRETGASTGPLGIDYQDIS